MMDHSAFGAGETGFFTSLNAASIYPPRCADARGATLFASMDIPLSDAVASEILDSRLVLRWIARNHSLTNLTSFIVLSPSSSRPVLETARVVVDYESRITMRNFLVLPSLSLWHN